MEFCRKFTELYTWKHCHMNMHLHGHLAECIRDYGPVYSFWCFSFERMNGILGSFHTNNKNISVQLTRRFLDSKLYAPMHWPGEFVREFFPLLKVCNYQKGSLMQATLETEISRSSPLALTPLPPIQECALQPWQLQELRLLFDRLNIV